MTERSTQVVWVRYTWDLQNLKVNLQPPTGYEFRSAFPDERDVVLQVVLSAYGTDSIWKPFLKSIETRLTERIHDTLGTPDAHYLVAEFEARAIAVSGIAKSHWTDQNFLTGICVFPSQQRKGLGKYLLALSLLRLREMGVSEARVYTGVGSLADRKLYPLFGSKREEGVEYPGVRPLPPQQSERS